MTEYDTLKCYKTTEQLHVLFLTYNDVTCQVLRDENLEYDRLFLKTCVLAGDLVEDSQSALSASSCFRSSSRSSTESIISWGSQGFWNSSAVGSSRTRPSGSVSVRNNYVRYDTNCWEEWRRRMWCLKYWQLSWVQWLQLSCNYERQITWENHL